MSRNMNILLSYPNSSQYHDDFDCEWMFHRCATTGWDLCCRAAETGCMKQPSGNAVRRRQPWMTDAAPVWDAALIRTNGVS